MATTSTPRPSKVPAIVATGITAVVLGVAVVAFKIAHSTADDAPFAIDAAAFEDDKQKISRWNTVMGVTGATAVAGAAVSTYLWVRATRSTKTRLEVAPTGGGAKVSLGLRF